MYDKPALRWTPTEIGICANAGFECRTIQDSVISTTSSSPSTGASRRRSRGTRQASSAQDRSIEPHCSSQTPLTFQRKGNSCRWVLFLITVPRNRIILFSRSLGICSFSSSMRLASKRPRSASASWASSRMTHPFSRVSPFLNTEMNSRSPTS